MTITPQEKTRIENEIKRNFDELKKRLEELKSEVTSEMDETKKQQKQEEIQKIESDLALIDRISSLQEQELLALKTRVEEYSRLRQQTQWETTELLREKTPTPTTYELLKDSNTCSRLLNIISSNPKEFEKLPWATPEAKLEYIFSKIRNSVVLFLKNKLWNSEKYENVINNTIAPALEWSLMEMLRNQWNETNVSMLKWIDKISWDSFNKLVNWVSNFAKRTKWSYNKFSQWINAIDYLSVHNWVLNKPEKSAVLSSPIEFENYLNNAIFASASFSPYAPIDGNIFKIDENQTFEFWISLQDKQNVLNEIWDIQVVNNPKTTALITKMLDKPEKFLSATSWLQKAANGLLDWVNAINSVTKIFWMDIIWEFSKAPEQRSFLYRIIDFVCKLIWITGWLEWIIKRWRLDRLNLTDEKNENISQIFKEYQKIAWKWTDITITDENSCRSILNEFSVTDLDSNSTTKWDYLRDTIADNMDLELISPSVVQQTLWESYLKREIVVVNWKQQEKISVDSSKITEDQKRELAHKHMINMKSYFEENYSDLTDFYANIHNTDDLVICMTASLYASKDDVVEWIKAKVFLPENYGVVYQSNPGWWNGWNETPDSNESADKTKDLLIWPKLSARNKDEIWWLWNSIMNWFQWLNEKTNFPNMDWIEWKSTVTHPNRFTSQNDVLAYKNTHTNIKSFMFYFWENTRDNNRTISDIKQRSEWLQAEWIQPVLCTCIWEDKETWLKDLNQKLVSLWREKNWPVIDFAKSYNRWDITLSSDWVHPDSYSLMTDIINKQFTQA